MVWWLSTFDKVRRVAEVDDLMRYVRRSAGHVITRSGFRFCIRFFFRLSRCCVWIFGTLDNTHNKINPIYLPCSVVDERNPPKSRQWHSDLAKIEKFQGSKDNRCGRTTSPLWHYQP